LIIYGGNHLVRIGVRSIVNLLENDDHGTVFSVWTNTQADLATLQDDVSSWPKPSLVFLRDTMLGAKGVRSYPPAVGDSAVRMQDQFDAILYVGSPSSITYSRATKALCKDPKYGQMRLQRFALIGEPRTEEQFCTGLAAQ
jgi:hypothetical protein